jgi:hypothetical protein
MAFTGNYTCNSFKQQLFEVYFDFSATTTQTFKIALYTNDATLSQTTTSYTGTTGEVSATGYTAGGVAITPSLAIDSSTGIVYIDFSNASWSGAFTARGALIYRVTTGNPAICVLDFGSDKTSTTTFQVEFPPNTSTGALIRLS